MESMTVPVMVPPLLQLLDEQYICMEAFANTQSRLWNVSSFTVTTTNKTSSSSSSSLRRRQDDPTEEIVEQMTAVMGDWESCRQRVQMNLKQLLDDEFCRKHKDHIDLSIRVIKTIAKNPTWGTMGIPTHTTGILETNTIALVALRASIAKVKESYGI